MTIDKTTAYRGDGNPKWRGDDARYLARHVRVRTERGKASEYTCAECADPAAEWAQIHDADPFDIMGYKPMCVKCHRNYDIGKARRGNNHGRAKVTEDIVRSIRVRYTAGEKQIDLAAEFGVTQGTIHKIVARRIWKEVMPLCQCRSRSQRTTP